MSAKPIMIDTGTRFGKLVVQHEAPRGKCGHTRSVCLCDCGNVVTVHNSRLVSGHTRSCGCLVAETSAKVNLQHGESGSRLHNIWRLMKNRCGNPAAPAYKWYGARGIMVCEKWRTSYPSFAKWAKTHGYSETLTLDRIDPNGGYSPDNCRFVSNADQQRNRRSNKLITYKGETMCLEQWARKLGINSGGLHARLFDLGWPVRFAFTEPVGTVGRHGKQRPYALYGRHPWLETMFGVQSSYEALASVLADYIGSLLTTEILEEYK